MKRTIFTILLLFVAFLLSATSYKVLFIGNSYTSVNDLPQLIQRVSYSVGDTITYSTYVPGGSTFQQNLSGAASLIQQGGWDYVVLQEQSQLPSFPPSQFMNECYPYAQQLCESVRQYSPNAKIVFYMTWGRKNGDQQNCQYYPPLCTYEGMDSLLYARYMMMAEDNHAYVSPVGYVWHYIRDNHPSMELYQSDESHPSLLGSYVAACCFYTMLFEKNPMSISENCGVDAASAQLVRDLTSRLVYDSLSKWQFSNVDSTSIQDRSLPVVVLYPNPAVSFIEFDTPFESEFTINLLTAEGRLVRTVNSVSGVRQHLDVSNLKDGFYFINLVSKGGKSVTSRFVKTSL